MGTPYLAETRIFSFNYAPRGWAMCNGQVMAINQNQALFALLGTTFGGNGTSTFNLPNLQGCAPVHFGNGFTMGQIGGEVNHTLTTAEMSGHTHGYPIGTQAATQSIPTGQVPATPAASFGNFYASGSPVALAPQAIGNGGGSQPHSNMQPYLVLNVCIALVGIFPSRN
jgi:microcystin-dependent protein